MFRFFPHLFGGEEKSIAEFSSCAPYGVSPLSSPFSFERKCQEFNFPLIFMMIAVVVWNVPPPPLPVLVYFPRKKNASTIYTTERLVSDDVLYNPSVVRHTSVFSLSLSFHFHLNPSNKKKKEKRKKNYSWNGRTFLCKIPGPTGCHFLFTEIS